MGKSRDVGRAVERFVNRKALKLQNAYLSGSSSSRATLARLRRLDQPSAGSWMVVGEDIFEDLPDLGLSGRDSDRVLRAIKCAMKLYALHQQSKTQGMALVPNSDDWRQGSFGRACYQITCRKKEDQSGAAGVVRRMSMVEAANDFEGVEICLRSLVLLMRANDVRLNYGSLAKDLFLIQSDVTRDGVFMRWARDYYVPPESKGDSGK